MRICKNLALAMVIAIMSSGSVRAELCNQYTSLPSSNVTVYTITIAGNVMNQLNLTETQNDPGLNPFQYAIQNFSADSGGSTTVTAALDGNGNTVVTFQGLQSDGITPVTLNSSLNGMFLYSPHDHNGLPHAGLDGSTGAAIPGGGPALNIIAQGWSNSGMTYASPAVSVSEANPPTSGPVHYAAFFVDVTTNGVTSGQWFELPYTTGTAPSLTLTNYTGSSETLSNAGYFTSPTMIPLDQLNYGFNPPPGELSSPFVPLPGLDGRSLPGGDGIGGAGGSIMTGSLPEPSSIISMATGLLVVAGYLVRRRLGGRPGRPAPIA